jgi:hypothetical protein
MCLLGVQVVTENVADLLKIVSMRGNRLGAALSGGVTRTNLPPGTDSGLAKEGFPIPDQFQERLGRFDKNGDGKLSSEEIDAMPAAARERVRQAIQRLEDR